MKCTNNNIGKLITRYEFNLLSEEERKIFEEHLFECEFCFKDLKKMAKVIEAMKKNPEKYIHVLADSVELRKNSFLVKIKNALSEWVSDFIGFLSLRWIKRHALAFSIGLSIIMVICAIILWRSSYIEEEKKEILTFETQKDTITPVPKQIQIKKYKDLAMVEPALYMPLTLKGSEQKIDSIFARGMKFYNESNYKLAIEELQSARRINPRNVDVNFYLGISYLLKDSIDKAIIYLKNMDSLGGVSYSEKAHWYLGNAYLMKEKPQSALVEFQIVFKGGGEYEYKAKEMINKILRSKKE